MFWDRNTLHFMFRIVIWCRLCASSNHYGYFYPPVFVPVSSGLVSVGAGDVSAKVRPQTESVSDGRKVSIATAAERPLAVMHGALRSAGAMQRGWGGWVWGARVTKVAKKQADI